MKDFEQSFHDTLSDIKAKAAGVGMNMTSLCKDLGIARATPDRWLIRTPKTIKIVAQMQRYIDEKSKEGPLAPPKDRIPGED